MKPQKHTVVALLILLFISLMLSACGAEGSDSDVNGAMVAMKDDNGTITGYERRYLDDDGNITRWDRYDADQVYQSFVLYEYYDDGKLYTETYYRADGIAESRTAYVYDDDGHLYEKSYEYPHGDALTERYDADGELIEKFYYDENEQLSQHDVLENGTWVSYDADDTIME